MAEEKVDYPEAGDATRGLLGSAEIAKRFGFHKDPNVEQRNRALAIRQEFINLAIKLDLNLPPGRAKSTALTHLEDTAVWASKAITERWPLAGS